MRVFPKLDVMQNVHFYSIVVHNLLTRPAISCRLLGAGLTSQIFSVNAVVLLWFSVAFVWCQSLGDVSPYVCSYYFKFGSFAEWPPFGK